MFGHLLMKRVKDELTFHIQYLSFTLFSERKIDLLIIFLNKSFKRRAVFTKIFSRKVQENKNYLIILAYLIQYFLWKQLYLEIVCIYMYISTTKLNPSCNLDIPKYLMFRFKNISKKLCMCKSHTDICKIQAFYLAYVEHIYNIFGTIRLHELYVYLMMVFLEKKEENWMVI